MRQPHWYRYLETTALAAAVVGLVLSAYAIHNTHEVIQEEREARAWQILATKTPGNSGKGAAIETLAKAGADLRAIDISCEALGGDWHDYSAFDFSNPFNFYSFDDPKTEPCQRHTILQGIDVSAKTLGKSFKLSKSNFSGVRIVEGDFGGADLSWSDFSGSEISESSFKGANTQVFDASRSHWRHVDLSRLSPSGGMNWGFMNFNQSAWYGVNASDARLTNSCFLNTLISSGYQEDNGEPSGWDTSFRNSDLSWTAFIFSEFSGPVSMEGANLTETSWLLGYPDWKNYLAQYHWGAEVAAQDFLRTCSLSTSEWERQEDRLITEFLSEIDRAKPKTAPADQAQEEQLITPDVTSLRHYFSSTNDAQLGLQTVNFNNSFVVNSWLVQAAEIIVVNSDEQNAALEEVNTALGELTDSREFESDAIILEDDTPPLDEISRIDRNTQIIRGIPAYIAPEWICFVASDFYEHEPSVPGRPSQDRCVRNPVFVDFATRSAEQSK